MLSSACRYKLGRDFAVFVPTVHQMVLAHPAQFQRLPGAVPALERYQRLVSRVLKSQPLPPFAPGGVVDLYAQHAHGYADGHGRDGRGGSMELDGGGGGGGGGSGGGSAHNLASGHASGHAGAAGNAKNQGGGGGDAGGGGRGAKPLLSEGDAVMAALLRQIPAHGAALHAKSTAHKRLRAELEQFRQQRGTFKADVQKLSAAWDVRDHYTAEDWEEWMRRLSVELLRESPSPSLRPCAVLAQVHQPLARELFNASFSAAWAELREAPRDSVVRAVEAALISPNLPPLILATLLNLAEFMDHDDRPLPIDIRLLGRLAEQSHAYVRALAAR